MAFFDVIDGLVLKFLVYKKNVESFFYSIMKLKISNFLIICDSRFKLLSYEYFKKISDNAVWLPILCSVAADNAVWLPICSQIYFLIILIKVFSKLYIYSVTTNPFSNLTFIQ